MAETSKDSFEERTNKTLDKITDTLTAMSAEISSMNSRSNNMDLKYSNLTSDISHLRMQFGHHGNMPERVERAPSGHGLLEPKSGWGRKPLYDR